MQLIDEREWRDALDALLDGARAPALLVMALSFGGVGDARGGYATDGELESQLEARVLRVFGASQATKIDVDSYAVVCFLEPSVSASCSDITDQLSEPLAAGPFRFGLKVSLGCFLVDPSARSAEDCLQRCRSALLAAEQVAGPAVVFYGDPSEETLRKRQRLQPVLARGEYEHLRLAYQPIIDVHTGRAVGMEALARWSSPGLEDLGAQTFISIAEACGQINAVSTAMVSRAIRECPVWEHGATLFLNLSGRDLASRRTMNQLADVLRVAGVPCDKIIFEITETAVLDIDRAAEIMGELRARGLRFALDDFGTGESGLHRLARLPLDTLKIDRELISAMTLGGRGRAAVHSVIELSRSLSLNCILEGIETQAHALQASLLGARYMQGYHFAKPLPPHQAMDWIRSPSLPRAV